MPASAIGPALLRRLAQVTEQSLQPVAIPVLKALKLELHRVGKLVKVDSSAASSILGRAPSLCLVILKLVAFATRLPAPAEDGDARLTAKRSLANGAELLLNWLVAKLGASGGNRGLAGPASVRALLRSQALEAAARQAAGAAKRIQDAQPLRQALLTDCEECLDLALFVVGHASINVAPNDAEGITEFAAALAVSSILEHSARLTLVLSSAKAARVALPAHRALTALRSERCCLAYLYCGLVLDCAATVTPAAAAHLRAVLGGPCTRHIVMVEGLAALRELEGGPPPGAPPAGHSPAKKQQLISLLQALFPALDPAHPGPALKPLAAARLLLRAALAAVTSDGGPAADGGSGARSDGPCWVAKRLPDLVCRALALRPWRGPRLAVAADVWRLAAALLGQEQVMGRDLERGSVAASLNLLMVEVGVPLWAANEGRGLWRLPAEAPVEVLAAVTGGALPLLERLLRRAGEAPGGPEHDVLAELQSAEAPPSAWRWDNLLPILVYSTPLQAAAFVATATKLLRRASAQALLLRHSDPATISVELTADLLGAWMEYGHEAPHEGIVSAPARARLAQLLTLALPQWLPQLSRLVQEAAALDEAAWGAEQHGQRQPGPQEPELLLQALYSLTEDVFAAYALVSLDPCPAPGMQGAAHTAGHGGGACNLEAGVVPLLGSVLRLVQRGQPSPEEWPQLYYFTAAWAVRLARTRTAAVRALSNDSPAMAWRPEAMRAVAEALRPTERYRSLVQALDGRAAQLEAWAGGKEAGARPGLHVNFMPPAATWLEFWKPPAEAQRCPVLTACDNPACASLAGDSEAGLRLRQCGRCGRASYCCRECQTAHWRAGHREACGGSVDGA
ncbi:hypothetical protein HYH03_006304 [Edaphochlamys debaryana]|uniref:phytol kinase n=1 Tax=Edaphochlamys debaryana TaxID=47281 RepID=A0A835Y5U6_9CHLO|nr:hypothetical protein HYH03_006304 [Edaphochlamys debaryana]|eukprot:KAG2495704.1 hypothetical protein HYH03_006304 [Edaphochlamys debaryana]